MTIKRIFGTCAVTMVAAVSAATLWFAGAGTALAPEPARLDGNLSGNRTWAPATYVNTSTPTYGYQVPKTWTTSSWAASIPVGTPCADYNAPAGTILPGVIVRQGNYTRCAGSY